MPEITGTVVVVQEGRLNLVDDQGAGHLVILSHKSGAEPQQLYDLELGKTRVRISFSEPDNIIGLLAETVEILDRKAAA